MPEHGRRHLTYANVAATIALVASLGGGAWAATQLPANSVGTKQLRANAVTSTKVKNHTLLASDIKDGVLPPRSVSTSVSEIVEDLAFQPAVYTTVATGAITVPAGDSAIVVTGDVGLSRDANPPGSSSGYCEEALDLPFPGTLINTAPPLQLQQGGVGTVVLGGRIAAAPGPHTVTVRCKFGSSAVHGTSHELVLLATA